MDALGCRGSTENRKRSGSAHLWKNTGASLTSVFATLYHLFDSFSKFKIDIKMYLWKLWWMGCGSETSVVTNLKACTVEGPWPNWLHQKKKVSVVQ